MYYKVITKDQLIPGKIQFNYDMMQFIGGMTSAKSAGLEVKQKVDLNVFMSKDEKNREPNKENCDEKREKPRGALKLPANGKDRFENPEVYITLFSLTGC